MAYSDYLLGELAESERQRKVVGEEVDDAVLGRIPVVRGALKTVYTEGGVEKDPRVWLWSLWARLQEKLRRRAA